MSPSAAVRSGYHHGDLRNALIEAAAELAQSGGPRAVTIRAAARVVGVTPTAAYRHFAGHEELLAAAKDEAMARLTAAMDEELRLRTGIEDRVERALGNLAALGRGYLNFALAQPGLFHTAFSRAGTVLPPRDAQRADGPFGKLVDALDELVACGYLPDERRPLAEFTAWSMTHGMAMLFVDGPMREAGEDIRDEALLRSMLLFAEGLGGGALSEQRRAVVARAARGPAHDARSADVPLGGGDAS
ncbi:TetR/AcrR family transcriptional regulator [Qaidamihabitans albus]|uniref:TetR/AcrR family transcriptional regulator n=1 Tax=Qaidamihabitans albus TaxID=2795733 RepID=UPI0018F15054|nr:TetR/AcrR family transcriptional regulator [Qaidamihabitans albus]